MVFGSTEIPIVYLERTKMHKWNLVEVKIN